VAHANTGCLIGALALLLVPAVSAAGVDDPWYVTLYLQQSFPKQTNTNKQIQQINDTFGVHFDDWGDVHNLSLGAQLFKRVSPYWKLGVQVDYSSGSIDGNATVPTEAGPARLAFEQRYDVYADLYVVAHFLPCPTCTRVVPFVYGGGGIGYEKDKTTLTLTNEYLGEELRVDNDGTFPTFSVGAGIDVPLSSRDRWYVELGGAYVWARLKHNVPAKGSLAPAPEVLADTDSSGPNYWVGIGLKF
jgi:opacity protein-like surface antigen